MNIDSKKADQISLEEIYKELNSNSSGLSSEEAIKRLQQYGENGIVEKKKGKLSLLLVGFWGPIPWMIEVAALLSALVKHWEDFIIISILLISNALIEFLEENSANNALEDLKNKLALDSLVLRDGKWINIPAKNLVPGDIVQISLGNIVPADVKLIEGDYLNIDQSALTGESLSIEKKIGDIAYSGTIAKQGKMQGMVINTGSNTLFGQTAKLIDTAKNVSHFQKAVIKIGNFLIITALVLIAVLGIFAYIRQESLIDFVSFALVLLVAAIPAALPTVLSVTMVIGVKYLSKRNAIVSHMTALEELSGMDILCSDKTGTLTQNQLTIKEIIPYGNNQESDVLKFAVLSSDETSKDAIDHLVIDSFKEKYPQENTSNYRLIKFTPFDPISKRTEATFNNNSNDIIISKGAPQAISRLLTNKAESDFVTEKANLFADKGFRALAVATKINDLWQLNGIFAMYDPPREDSKETLFEAESYGIKIKMITGDQVAIAAETAQLVGLGTNILNANELDDKNEKDIINLVNNSDGFAQVFPEHKFKIVKALQSENLIVGMTGDGVNDAPALKQANIGIAVEGATDASKSAADLILTDKGIAVIIDAIKNSRKIFARMENYTIYRIAESLRILLFIFLFVIIFKSYPITALMIVLLAILNDMSIITIAYDNVQVAPKPLKWNMKFIMSQATILGLIGVTFTFSCVWFANSYLGLNTDELHTFVYLKLSIAGQMTVFLARNRGHFWESKPAKPLWLSIVSAQSIAIIFSVYGILLPVGIGWMNAFVIFGFVAVEFFVTDFLKVMINKTFFKELFVKN